MSYNIVLVEPEIPNNTGNIGRLALASGSHLHLIKPFGFELSDSRVKRAGLDYWKHVPLTVYENIEDFLSQHGDKKLALFSSHATKSHWDAKYTKDMFLLFGKESTGLSQKLVKQYSNSIYKIPVLSNHVRSLNLANAVSIVVYEALRQSQ